MNLGKFARAKQDIFFKPNLGGDAGSDLGSDAGELAGSDLGGNLNSTLDELLDELKLKVAGSSEFLEKQMASLEVEPEVVSGLQDILNNNFMSDKFRVELPGIDVDLQEVDVPKDFMQALNFKGSEDLKLDGNSIKLMFSDLMSFKLQKPASMSSFPLSGDGSNLSSNLSSSLSSNLNLNTSILGSNIFKSKSNLDSLVVPNNLGYLGGNVACGINDVTYSDFESRGIESTLARTGKFDTQVDMNDFIRKTCGFKSLLPESTPEALFDAVKLASDLKGSSRQFDSNDDAVSVVYDLLKKDEGNLSSTDLTHIKDIKENLSGVLGTGMSGGLKQRLWDVLLNSGLGSGSNLSAGGSGLGSNLNSNLNSGLGSGLSSNLNSNLSDARSGSITSDFKPNSFGPINDVGGDDIHMLLEEVRDFLSWACRIDLDKSIVEPLGFYFTNMESAINALADAINMQGVSSQNNMSDYKMGSEISRMP
uniref:Uncharacterized protein n=1 Tax=Borrelia hermsii TaxID=140 RepID=S4VN00_BORHE|nr:hypothetical protein [Borrelia hermsii]AGO68831.1 hypothetical protein BHA087 [Borrelia hermsii]